MEGLTRLIESGGLGDYSDFHFAAHGSMDILHFGDDTIIFGDGGTRNLWSLKAILRGFELMSGLKVNFCKSNVYNNNLSDRTLNFTSFFLACGIGNFPFKF